MNYLKLLCVSLAVLFTACKSPREVVYLQDVVPLVQQSIEQQYEVIIHADDLLSIVVNSSGKIFPLLMEKSDIGKNTLSLAKAAPKRTISKVASHKTSFWDYESEKMNDTDNWSDPYGDEQAYYGGWSREDVESGLADAYEGDSDARWNND